MNKPQTSVALLADFADPSLTELDLCERHALTLDALLAIAESPPFRHALATIRAVRDARAPTLLERARLTAARVLTTLSDRDAPTIADAREIRLVLKDLLRLLTPSDDQPGTPTMSKANRGVPEDRDTPNQAAGFPQPTANADPLLPPLPSPTGEDRGEGSSPSSPYPTCSSDEPPASTHPLPPSAQWQSPTLKPNPTPKPKPKRPRNTKPRPKARSR